MTDAQRKTAVQTWEYCKDVARNVWLLQPSDEYIHAVAMLLMGTAAHESNMTYRRQMGFFPENDRGAFSLWQMERPGIEMGLRQIKQNPRLSDVVATMTKWDGSIDWDFTKKAIQRPDGDLFACILARLYYLRYPGAIPETVYGQAQYWKKYWNTYQGAGTVTQYLDNWERFAKEIVEADIG